MLVWADACRLLIGLVIVVILTGWSRICREVVWGNRKTRSGELAQLGGFDGWGDD